MEFHVELFRSIRQTVRSSLETTDDACAFAWLQFLHEQPDRDQNWQGWLYRVAQREAWRLNALDWKERDHVGQDGKRVVQPDPRDRYDERIRFDAALQELKKLPPALQRVVLIRSQVWKQEEVAEVMGISPDQVERLLRAAAVQLAEVNESRHDITVIGFGEARGRPAAERSPARILRRTVQPPGSGSQWKRRGHIRRAQDVFMTGTNMAPAPATRLVRQAPCMPDCPALVELVAIAARSAETADSNSRERELFDAYEELRTHAITLARAQEWATPEQMADQFPSLTGFDEIEMLNAASRETETASVLSDGALAARVRQALVELAAWARGIVIAYQALDRDVEGDA